MEEIIWEGIVVTIRDGAGAYKTHLWGPFGKFKNDNISTNIDHIKGF